MVWKLLLFKSPTHKWGALCLLSASPAVPPLGELDSDLGFFWENDSRIATLVLQICSLLTLASLSWGSVPRLPPCLSCPVLLALVQPQQVLGRWKVCSLKPWAVAKLGLKTTGKGARYGARSHQGETLLKTRCICKDKSTTPEKQMSNEACKQDQNQTKTQPLLWALEGAWVIQYLLSLHGNA